MKSVGQVDLWQACCVWISDNDWYDLGTFICEVKVEEGEGVVQHAF